MRSQKDKLERKIQDTIRKMQTSPIGEKEKYCTKLEKYFDDYKKLTGEAYRIQ